MCNVSDLSGPRERCGKKDTGSEDAGEPTQGLVALVKGCPEYRRQLAYSAVKPVAGRAARRGHRAAIMTDCDSGRSLGPMALALPSWELSDIAQIDGLSQRLEGGGSDFGHLLLPAGASTLFTHGLGVRSDRKKRTASPLTPSRHTRPVTADPVAPNPSQLGQRLAENELNLLRELWIRSGIGLL